MYISAVMYFYKIDENHIFIDWSWNCVNKGPPLSEISYLIIKCTLQKMS